MTVLLETIAEPLIALMVVLGAVLSMISAFGIIRLPDAYTRSHAATKSTTLGVLIVLLSAFLFFIVYAGEVSARLLLGIVFVFITAPVSGHLIGRAAYRSGIPLAKRSVRDDLRQAIERQEAHLDKEK